MKLAQLIADLGADIRDCADTELTGLVTDSRAAAPGLAFLAVRGALNSWNRLPSQSTSTD